MEFYNKLCNIARSVGEMMKREEPTIVVFNGVEIPFEGKFITYTMASALYCQKHGEVAFGTVTVTYCNSEKFGHLNQGDSLPLSGRVVIRAYVEIQ